MFKLHSYIEYASDDKEPLPMVRTAFGSTGNTLIHSCLNLTSGSKTPPSQQLSLSLTPGTFQQRLNAQDSVSFSGQSLAQSSSLSQGSVTPLPSLIPTLKFGNFQPITYRTLSLHGVQGMFPKSKTELYQTSPTQMNLFHANEEGLAASFIINTQDKTILEVHSGSGMFRDTKLFQGLPKLIDNRFGNKMPPIEMYGVGTGEDIDSIIIAMHKNSVYSREPLTIHATDLSMHALNRAMVGQYTARDERDQKAFGEMGLDPFSPIYYDRFIPEANVKAHQSQLAQADAIRLMLSMQDMRRQGRNKESSSDELAELERIVNQLVARGPEPVYKIRSAFRQNVRYDIANILEASQSPYPQPTIIMFRNAWYHLSNQEQRQLAQNLYQNLPEGSMVCVGSLESASDPTAIEKLLSAGFVPVTEHNLFPFVFEKQSRPFNRGLTNRYVQQAQKAIHGK